MQFSVNEMIRVNLGTVRGASRLKENITVFYELH